MIIRIVNGRKFGKLYLEYIKANILADIVILVQFHNMLLLGEVLQKVHKISLYYFVTACGHHRVWLYKPS